MLKKKSKYKNIKTVVDGIKFDSKAEATYYGILNILKRTGKVKDFEMQVVYTLTAGIKYILDFKVEYSDGRIDYIDIKGMKTQVFRIKQKLMKHDHDIDITCLKRIGRSNSFRKV